MVLSLAKVTDNVNELCETLKNPVFVESVTGQDMFYTDGSAGMFIGKLRWNIGSSDRMTIFFSNNAETFIPWQSPNNETKIASEWLKNLNN